MKYKLVFNKAADQDIMRAIEWYNSQQEFLGDRFYSQLKNTLDNLEKNPNLWSVRYDEVHCALVNKFPFLIHYIIEDRENKIIVLGVLHTSLNPEEWKKRKNE